MDLTVKEQLLNALKVKTMEEVARQKIAVLRSEMDEAGGYYGEILNTFDEEIKRLDDYFMWWVFAVFFPPIILVMIPLSVVCRIKLTKKKKQKAEFEASYLKDTLEPLERKNKAEIAEIEENLARFLKNTQEFLTFLPQEYRNFTAVSFLYRVIDNGRADSLKEAKNLFEEEKRHWETKKLLQDQARVQQLHAEYMAGAMAALQENQEQIHRDLQVVQGLQFAELIKNS